MIKKGNVFVRTDLACEAASCLENIEGTEYSKKDADGCSIERLKIITEDTARKLGKKCGCYVTLKTRELWKIYDEDIDRLACIVGDELKRLICLSINKDSLPAETSVLIAGLGNSRITADAIGPETVSRLTVTRHIKELDPSLFKKLEMCELSAIAPGVFGETGIESADLVQAAAQKIKPHLIIVIDALAAGSIERLACTVQISDTGINPGAGIGNLRCELSRDTLVIHVIALGVPTVVDTSSVVYDAICRVGASDNISDELKNHLERSERFYVTPKESDLITEKFSMLLAISISHDLGIF